MRSVADEYGIPKSAVFESIAGVAKSCKRRPEEKELASILLWVVKEGLRGDVG